MKELRQTAGINLNAVDSMVLSYMLSEGLTEETGLYDFGREAKRKCVMIKDLIASGDIEQAKEHIQEVCPKLLEDNHVQFLLKKQVLIEMLRQKTEAGDTDALRWIRDELAPSALTAYPAAYEEFKKLLLMLVFEESTSGSPVTYEWSDASRLSLAELIYGTLRAMIGFKDPDLVNVLKYLSLHVGSSETETIVEEVKDEPWIEKICVAERMPAPMHLGGESAVVEVSKKDVEAISCAMDIPQEEATNALLRNKGDVSAAFESEIGRLKLNVDELNNLVLEYAGYRGLMQLSESESEETDCKNDFQDSKSDTDMMDVQEDTGDGLSKCLSEADKPSYPVKRSRKLGYKHDANLKVILSVLKKVKAGRFLEAIDHVREIDEELYTKYPQVLFELWRFEILRVAESGSYDMALETLRRHLTPIVKTNTELLPQLQETLTTIVAPKTESPSTSRLCTVLQTALQESMKLPGPQLISCLKYFLDEHQSWVRARSFQDIFAKNLGIDVLLHGGSEILLAPTHNPTTTNANAAAHGEGQEAERPPGETGRSDSMGWRSATSDESVVELSELVINQVMEVLHFPRAHVIDLLRQHEGNAELAVLHVVQQGEEQ